MIQRSSVVIDKNKSKEFLSFLRKNAKKRDFWNNVKKETSVKIEKKELDRLFE